MSKVTVNMIINTHNTTNDSMIINTIISQTIISIVIAGEWVEVIMEKHRQNRLMHEIHAGSMDGEMMSARNSGGHIGINKMVRAVCLCFYWPDISGQVRNFINSCETCQIKKDIAIQKSATVMHPVPVPTKVMSQIGIDLMQMKETPDGYNYVITAVDYFTKYAEMGALKDKSATTIGKWIYENIFCR